MRVKKCIKMLLINNTDAMRDEFGKKEKDDVKEVIKFEKS